MSHAASLLARPRNAIFLLLLLPILSILFYSRSFLNTSKAIGYVAPHVVLPSYVSTANIPLCLPNKVEDHGMNAGWRSYWRNSGTGYWDGSMETEGVESGNKAKQGMNGATSAGQTPLVAQDAVPVDGITNYMKAHIESKQQGFNAEVDHDYLGLNIGSTWDLDEYTAELLASYDKYLSVPHIPNPSYLPPLLSRLSLRPPIAPLPPRPKQIITTDKSQDHLPEEFNRWSEIMPDWSIRYFDDEGLASWMSTMFGGTSAESIWASLPRPVLKADMFRYMIMLVEGGIYTDSDTAPIIPAEEWGKGYENGTDKLLVDLSRVLSMASTPYLNPAHQPDSGEEVADSEKPSVEGSWMEKRRKAKNNWGLPRLGPGSAPLVDDGSELGIPSLVISVESDAIEFGWTDWREVGLSRAVQIVQWTFMARPGHPIFLDAIGRTLEKTEHIMRMEREAKDRGEIFVVDSALGESGPTAEPNEAARHFHYFGSDLQTGVKSILMYIGCPSKEWTGPAVFTDCVYRYLLARYGFKPRDLLHQKVPIRVGDVLILPAGSYSSVSPFGDEGQRDWAASWHGFFGRWRNDDPSITEFERLKKIKEEEKERIKQEIEKQEAEGRVEPEEDRQEDRRGLDS